MDDTKEFLRLRTRLKLLANRKTRGENINMVAYKKLAHTAFKLGQKISGKASLKNAINNAKKISAATRIQKAFRQKIRTNKQFLEEYRIWKRLGNEEEGEIPINTGKLTNYANKKFGTENLNLARNMIINKMHEPAKKIQQAFRRSRLTNEEYLKLYNKTLGKYSSNFGVSKYKISKMNSHVRTTLGKNRTSNENNTKTRNKIIEKRSKETPSVTTIQRIFRGYKSRNISTRKQFLMSLSKDGRFDYYVEVLAKLEYKVDRVLSVVKQNVEPLSAITGIIGVCHYKARPRKTVQNVTNIRKNILQLKKKTPREYLQSFRKQFAYVAKEYSKMSTEDKNAYRDRLNSELSGRPCLENLLDSLAKALVKPEFVWIGKTKNFENNPLVPNNVRYLGFGQNLGGSKGLVNTAIKTWAESKNKPSNWNNKNLNARKQMFWNMIKNLPVSMVYEGTIVNGTPRLYNRKGRKFKVSELSNTLNYI
jgi:hypothetical protein